MQEAVVERLKQEILYEFAREGPPEGFPKFPDLPAGRYRDPPTSSGSTSGSASGSTRRARRSCPRTARTSSGTTSKRPSFWYGATTA